MFVLVGLGNPGNQYKNNRHNIGFMTIDGIHEAFSFGNFREKSKGLYAQGKINGHDCLLVKPQTFMNKSGACVGPVVQFFKVPLDNVVVFHDELDLDFERIKIKCGGGSGGHNGLGSIDQTIGKNYWRVRMGIGHPGQKHLVSSYVLSNFSKSEGAIVPHMIQKTIDGIPQFLGDKNAPEWMNNIQR